MHIAVVKTTVRLRGARQPVCIPHNVVQYGDVGDGTTSTTRTGVARDQAPAASTGEDNLVAQQCQRIHLGIGEAENVDPRVHVDELIAPNEGWPEIVNIESVRFKIY